jgi:hypothetical protein
VDSRRRRRLSRSGPAFFRACLTASTPATRRAVAAAAGVPTAAIDAVAERGLMIPVAGAPTRPRARLAAVPFQRAGARVRVEVPLSPFLPFAIGALDGVAALLAWALLPEGPAAIAGAVAGAMALASLAVAFVIRGRRVRLRKARRALLSVPCADVPASPVHRALGRARKAALERDLPDAIRTDLLASANEIEDRLDGALSPADVSKLMEAATAIEQASAPAEAGDPDAARRALDHAHAARGALRES